MTKLSCWLNIYKPKSVSSAKVVSLVKQLLKGNKVGHCGTLDVEAEGVLPLAIGEATKLSSVLMNARKTYVFRIKFGSQTDTADHSGRVIATTEHIPSTEDCHNVCANFIGPIRQIPPAFSAIKVNGIRSYKLARESKSVELSSRIINIYNLKCLSFDKKLQAATYVVKCSKGTYVRTLAEDIALSLQSLGFVIELRRTNVGMFAEQDSLHIMNGSDVNIFDLNMQLLMANKLNIETVLHDVPMLEVEIDKARKVIYGQKCLFDNVQDMDFLWIKYQNNLLAIGEISQGCFRSCRVFNNLY